MSHDVFVSYSTRDKEIAQAVCESLEKDGIRCWIAPRDIQPGQEYADAIIDALNTCRVFLVILSEESNSSPQVRREVERAVSKDLTILTLRIDNTLLSKAMEYYLSSRHWLDASNAVLSNQLHNLSEAIKQLLGQFPVSMEESGGLKSYVVPEPEKPALQTAQATPATPVPTGVGQGSRKRSLGWLWVGGLLVLALVLAAIVFLLLPYSHLSLALPEMATATSTPYPTVTPDYAATSQANFFNETADAREAWVHGFAEPILSQIAGRSPDFQDDFSDPNWSYSHWSFFQGSTFANGQMVITAADQWQGFGLTIPAEDFVFSYMLSLIDVTAGKPMLGFSFREDGDELVFTHFTMNFDDNWCGIGEGGDASRKIIFSECEIPFITLGQRVKILVIAQGVQAAVYLDDHPLVYSDGLKLTGNNAIAIGESVSTGTASVAIDDVKIWYLK